MAQETDAQPLSPERKTFPIKVSDDYSDAQVTVTVPWSWVEAATGLQGLSLDHLAGEGGLGFGDFVGRLVAHIQELKDKKSVICADTVSMLRKFEQAVDANFTGQENMGNRGWLKIQIQNVILALGHEPYENHEKPASNTPFLDEYNRIELAHEELRRQSTKLLISRGWEHTSQTPGCLWMWSKKLVDGRTILVDKPRALMMEAHLCGEFYEED